VEKEEDDDKEEEVVAGREEYSQIEESGVSFRAYGTNRRPLPTT